MLSLLNIDYSSMISTLPLDSGSSDSLSNFINNGLVGLVTEADTTYKIAGSVIALILALIGCFFGYKLSRLFMGITGFIAGYNRTDSCFSDSACRRICLRPLYHTLRSIHCLSRLLDLSYWNFYSLLCISL